MTNVNGSLKEIMLDSIGHAVVAIDQEGKVLYWNQTAEHLYGWKSDEVIGKAASNFLLLPEQKLATELLSKSLRQGSSYQGEFQVKRADGKTTPIWISITPLINEASTQIGMVGVANDLSVQKKAERRLTLLAEINQLLNTTLVSNEILEQISSLLVPEFADWFVLDRINQSSILDVPVIMHKDPEKIKWGLELRRENPVDMNMTTGLAKVIKTGEPEFYPNITDDMLIAVAKNDVELALLRAVGYHSALIVPLQTPQAITGALTLVSTESEDKFTIDDLKFAQEIASRAAIALENARLYENQKDFANQLEKMVLQRTQEVQDLAGQLSLAEQKERQALATTLHDTVQQELYALQFALSTIKRHFAIPNDDPNILELDSILHNTMQVTRNITKDLNPPILDEIDFCKSLKWLAETMQERYGLNIHISSVESCDLESKAMRTLVFNLCRELLFNVVKHANVSEAQLSIKVDDYGLIVSIKDDGQGFLLDETLHDGTGLGLSGAHKRLRMFGGRLEIKSAPNQGTLITIFLPSRAFRMG